MRPPRAIELAVLATLLFAAPAAAQCHDGIVEGNTIRWRSRVEGETLIGHRGIPPGMIESRQRTSDPLRVPYVRGIQRITLRGARDRISFQPELDGPLVAHVRYHATPNISWRERQDLDATCGRAPAQSVRMYVDTDRRIAIRGKLRTSADRRRLFVLAGLGIAALVLALAYVAHRRLQRKAIEEHAEALLEQQFRDLGAEP